MSPSYLPREWVLLRRHVSTATQNGQTKDTFFTFLWHLTATIGTHACKGKGIPDFVYANTMTIKAFFMFSYSAGCNSATSPLDATKN